MYAYEEAEAVLDGFAAKQSYQFRRAYLRFKCVLVATARVDYTGSGLDTKTCLSYLWEDAAVAFRGHGDSTLTGCILQMWAYVSGESATAFHAALTEAFASAEAATPASTKRRYTTTLMAKPFCGKGHPHNYTHELPGWGPTLRDWALDNGEDPADFEDAFDSLLQTVNEVVPELKPGPRDIPVARRYMRLVDDKD